MDDRAFLERIANDEVRFGGHDRLHVRLRTETATTETGIPRRDYHITEVIDHLVSTPDPQLPFS